MAIFEVLQHLRDINTGRDGLTWQVIDGEIVVHIPVTLDEEQFINDMHRMFKPA